MASFERLPNAVEGLEQRSVVHLRKTVEAAGPLASQLAGCANSSAAAQIQMFGSVARRAPLEPWPSWKQVGASLDASSAHNIDATGTFFPSSEKHDQ